MSICASSPVPSPSRDASSNARRPPFPLGPSPPAGPLDGLSAARLSVDVALGRRCCSVLLTWHEKFSLTGSLPPPKRTDPRTQHPSQRPKAREKRIVPRGSRYLLFAAWNLLGAGHSVTPSSPPPSLPVLPCTATGPLAGPLFSLACYCYAALSCHGALFPLPLPCTCTARCLSPSLSTDHPLPAAATPTPAQRQAPRLSLVWSSLPAVFFPTPLSTTHAATRLVHHHRVTAHLICPSPIPIPIPSPWRSSMEAGRVPADR